MHQWQKSEKYSVVKTSKVFGVSETGYYKWKRTSKKPKSWQLLLVKMHKILDEHPDNKNYGIDRMMIALEQKGEKYSRSTVIRAMRKGNLLHESRRSPDGLTKADKKADRPEDIIQQDFTAERPNEKWLTDISQVTCLDGKLYISPVFDCYGGEVVSLSMDNHMKKELCIEAVKEAYRIRKPGSGVIIHSDAGSQYTSGDYKETMGKLHAIQSMSGVGRCFDNARMESFFATLKKEKLYQINTQKMKMEEVKAVIWRYVMVYYNRVRISTVNKNGLPPTIYRLQEMKVQATA